MERRRLGRTDIEVSACCLGTMTWGEQNTEAEGHAQLDRAIEAGINFIDTAEIYAVPPRAETYGRTEEIIGSWLQARGRRDDVIIASKIAGRSPMTWSRNDGAETRLTRAQIDEAVEKSLKRLQTDYIDLYQLHWPDRSVAAFGAVGYRDYDDDYESFEAQLEALDAHVKKGNIRHVGLSNETSWGVMKFVEAAERRGLPRLASIQNAYSLVNRTFEGGLAEVALRENVGLLAYSPLAQGYLTGKYRDGALPAGSRKALFNRLNRYERDGADTAVHAYVDLAAELGWDPAQFALKFVDTRPWVTATIIGATSLEQLETNLAAFDTTWTEDLEKAVRPLFVQHGSPCP